MYPNIKGLLEGVFIGKNHFDVGLVPGRMDSGLSQIIFTERFPVKQDINPVLQLLKYR